MPTTKNQAKILIAVTLFLMIAGCGNKTIISSDTYRGDEKSFAKFKDDYGKADWPEPETIRMVHRGGELAQTKNVLRRFLRNE